MTLKMKCCKRLKLMIAAIEKLADIAYDTASGLRLDNFINSPVAAVKSKELNKKSNLRAKYKLPGGKRGGRGQGTRLDAAMMDERRLLAGCTFPADVGGDTTEDDAFKFETDEPGFDDGQSSE